jgi:hypothetical protein
VDEGQINGSRIQGKGEEIGKKAKRKAKGGGMRDGR